VIADARILLQLLRGMPRAADAAQRLESFYAPQAASYDRFRERLLHGRRELVEALVLAPGAEVIEMGAGTGANLDFFGPRLRQLGSLRLVDLCPSLLEQAYLRARGLSNVHVVAADACDYRPPRPVDCVIFSYSLSMIPDWRRALGNAEAMLRPGGQLAVVDFLLPAATGRAGNRWSRAFWRRWFGHDGVMLNDAQLATLERLLPQHTLTVCRAPVPYLPWSRMPYYRFIGKNGGNTSVTPFL
jgi:S-adenosylmethionine-diacylgycerolhomoserine-N-methlytransferase